MNWFLICICRKNEEIDDRSMIKRLRKRIAELETELALLKAGQVSHVFYNPFLKAISHAQRNTG